MLILSACAPSFEKQEEVVQETNDSQEKAIVPKYNISDSYYRTISGFEPSAARGLVVSNLNTRLDVDEFETGLMRIAQDTFSPADYLFQDGQYLDKGTISNWLDRKLSPGQLEEEEMSESENLGLNPIDDEQGTFEERKQNNPIYLASILEHNYLVKNDDGKFELGGVVIGLALNSVYYYNLPETGYPREYEIDSAGLEKQGKQMAEEVLLRLRNIKGLENVPIVIALFKQEPKSSIVPGSFIAKADVKKESLMLEKWSEIDEEYYLFPSTKAMDTYREDSMRFLNFKADIDEYFPNYTGVIGKGFYKDEQLQQFTIEIPMQFYGKAEVIGFTQFVTGLVMEHFPSYISIQVYVSSVSGPESIIIRDAGDEDPFVHIYN